MAKTGKPSPIGSDELLSKKILKRPPVLINGVLPGEGGMILGGESEIGKSLIRTEISVLLACGLDIYGMKTPSVQTVIQFQSENSNSEEKERLSRVMRGHGIDSVHNRIFWAEMGWERSLLNKKFREDAIDQIKGVGATVVFWDPLISFLPSNISENNNVGMRAVLDQITKINRKCQCASVVIHHFSQPASDPKDEVPLRYRLRGASSIRDWADTIVVLQATGQSDNPGPGRKLTFTKIRNGPRRPPIFLERDRNFVHHRTDDKRKATAVTVIDVIKTHGEEDYYQGSQNELCALIEEAAGCSKPVAIRAIKEAIEARQIEELKVDAVKYWRIVEQAW